jgi:hypothetical protein
MTEFQILMGCFIATAAFSFLAGVMWERTGK